NLFGMWTWDSEAGIVLRRRVVNARHFIRVFDNLGAAVSHYLHTNNVGPAYRPPCELRAMQRARGEAPSPLVLAQVLKGYSARGGAYVAEIRDIIGYNSLDALPPLVIGN